MSWVGVISQPLILILLSIVLIQPFLVLFLTSFPTPLINGSLFYFLLRRMLRVCQRQGFLFQHNNSINHYKQYYITNKTQCQVFFQKKLKIFKKTFFYPTFTQPNLQKPLSTPNFCNIDFLEKQPPYPKKPPTHKNTTYSMHQHYQNTQNTPKFDLQSTNIHHTYHKYPQKINPSNDGVKGEKKELACM